MLQALGSGVPSVAEEIPGLQVWPWRSPFPAEELGRDVLIPSALVAAQFVLGIGLNWEAPSREIPPVPLAACSLPLHL